jgi:hypothetical protein
MTLAWEDYANYGTVSSRIDVGSTTGVVYDSHAVNGWSADVSSSAAYPGIYQESVIQGNNIYSFAELNSALYSGNEQLHSQGTAQRNGYFIVTGSGTVTFAIDYALDSFIQDTGPDVSSALARVGLSLNDLTNGSGLDAYNRAEVNIYTQSLLGESLSNADAGTISVSFDFADGDRGSFIAQATTALMYRPPARPVPEPSMLSLLGCALAGLVFLKRRA